VCQRWDGWWLRGLLKHYRILNKNGIVTKENKTKTSIWIIRIGLISLILAVGFISWKWAWLFVSIIPLLYLFCCRNYWKNHVVAMPEALVLSLAFTVLLLAFSPWTIKNKLHVWSSIFEEKLKQVSHAEIKIKEYSGSATFEGTRDKPGKITEQKDIPGIIGNSREIIVAQRDTSNIIRNGNFMLPLSSVLSSWGHGQYTDRMRSLSGLEDLFWVNFLNANINVQIVKTDIGPALKIENQTDHKDHQVGITEQYILCEPGKYRLSLWAKGEGVEPAALWCRTTSDWRFYDDETKMSGRIRGLNLPKQEEKTFSWKHFEQDIEMEGGVTTFTIVSKGKGILYLTDFSLIKIASTKNSSQNSKI
jgi:hypothetical protein